MRDTGRDEDAVPGDDRVHLFVETEHHLTLENHLLVLDGVVPVAGDAAAGLDGEAAGDEVRRAFGGAEQDLDRGPPRVRHRLSRHPGHPSNHRTSVSVAHTPPPTSPFYW